MRVLLTGASGQVGTAVRLSRPEGVELTALDRSSLDIADRAAVGRLIRELQPALVINAAAYTAVDKAEADAEACEQANAVGPAVLAEAIAPLEGTRLLHLSTDFVFDGLARQPYAPDAATHPLGVYGATKLAGERAVLAQLGRRGIVLRTSWVYAASGRNFVLTMLRLMRSAGKVRVVADQRGAPTYAGSIATALWRAASKPEVAGVHHWTDRGAITWYDFATAIAEEAEGAGLLQSAASVTPISTEEYPTAARRPAYSVLALEETASALGLEPVEWRSNLRRVIGEIVLA